MKGQLLEIAAGVLLIPLSCPADVTNRYLFLGHPRDDRPGEIVQRGVERIDFSAYDLLLLGGDYTWNGTGTRETVAYLDAVFELSAPTTLAALGNHDTSHRSFFTDVTGRPPFYAYHSNGITFVVLDTTDDGQDIVGAELQMLKKTVDSLSDSTHLVLIHHHILWIAGYPPLAHLQGSDLIGSSSGNLSGLNFYDEVYPVLLQARAKGVEVLCLAGDRTGTETEEFFIDHTTVDGVRFIAAGFKEELSPSLRTAVVLEHDTDAGTLSCIFKHLTDLPRIPDEPLVISELHYNPSPEQGNDRAFIELFNRGPEPYDLSGATFFSGVEFTFPSNLLVLPGERIVIAADSSHYAGIGTRVFAYEGSMKLEPDEPVALRDSRGLEIDFVEYGVSAPWPLEPDNQGASLMLVSTKLDNALAASWAASDQLGGTPGRANIAAPRPGKIEVNGNDITMSWSIPVLGAWYRVESSGSLGLSGWTPLESAVQAASSSIELNDLKATGSRQRFFRLARVFPFP